MSPTTELRATPPRRGRARTRPRPAGSAWTCPNCQRRTLPPRKRCADCGTSRY